MKPAQREQGRNHGRGRTIYDLGGVLTILLENSKRVFMCNKGKVTLLKDGTRLSDMTNTFENGTYYFTAKMVAARIVGEEYVSRGNMPRIEIAWASVVCLAHALGYSIPEGSLADQAIKSAEGHRANLEIEARSASCQIISELEEKRIQNMIRSGSLFSEELLVEQSEEETA